MTREYRITTHNISPPQPDDCVLSADDPAAEIQRLQFLGGLGNQARLQEYRSAPEGSNISKTAAEKVQIMKQNDIRPGDPEWFKLWFSLPLWFKEDPTDLR